MDRIYNLDSAVSVWADRVKLQDVVKVDKVEMELYGTRRYVIDSARLGEQFRAAGFVEGFDEAMVILEERLSAVDRA